MAHMAKYTAQALAPMLAHYDRSRAANKDIDNTRTCQNYNLAPDRGNLLNFISQKESEIKCQKRKDTIKLCDLVLTMPKDLDPAKADIFFKSSYIFLVNRYGYRQNDSNIVSCYVHKDESTPHMHFAFLPIAIEQKNKKRLGQPKLCAKEVITRQDLATLHKDLQEHLERELGCKVNILNGATQDGNRTIAELKQASHTADDIMDWLDSYGQDAERTKMGRGGLYGDEAIKMPVHVCSALVELARRGLDDRCKLKSLRNKRDRNADAQARADELSKELVQERERSAQYKQKLDEQIEYTATYGKQQYNKGYNKAKFDFEYDNATILKNGKLVTKAISNYPDLHERVNNILQTAQARDAERAQSKTNTRYTGR